METTRGSITVFLTLAGLLIFALLGTLVETARITVCTNHAQRTLRTSAEGLLTEYSRPLYEHYGLFFLEEGGIPYEEVIGGYVGDTMSAADAGDMDFMEGSLTSLSLTDKVYVGDDGAAALQSEINQYMGRVVTKEQLQKLLSRFNKLTDLEDKAEEIEETVEKEQDVAELDEELLDLMKWIDGITVSDGKVSCEDEFIKMFCVKKKKSQNFGITEGVVWKQMKGNIDETTRTWKIKNKKNFIKKLGRVEDLVDKAIEKGEKLAYEYRKIGTSGEDEHDAMLSDLIDNLPVLNRNKEILNKTQTLLSQYSVDECKDELVALWSDYDTKSIVFDYTGVDEAGGDDDPKDSLGDAWDKGILNLVCESPSELSDKSINNPDSYAQLYEEESSDEDYGDRVSQFTSDDEVNISGILSAAGSYSMDEFCLDQYITKQFGSYIQQVDGWEQPLCYGWEYIVAGQASDQDNLQSVLNRILLIRTVVNFLAIEQDSAKRKEAYSAAAAIVGFIGLAPLITLTQTLILITWSIVESMTDIAAMLLERHVPLIKKASDVKTTFAEVFLINQKAILKRAKGYAKAKKNSFGYKEYLMMFLMMTKQRIRRYRVMDLIEKGMRKNGYKGFALGSCAYKIKVEACFTFPTRFFRMAPIEAMLGRDVRSCQTTAKVKVSY